MRVVGSRAITGISSKVDVPEGIKFEASSRIERVRKKLKQEGLKIGSRLRRLYIAGRREYVSSPNNCLGWCHADKTLLRRPFSVSIYDKGRRGGARSLKRGPAGPLDISSQ